MSQAKSSYAILLGFLFAAPLAGAAENQDLSPRPEEQQLPRAMHSKMKDRPRITVGSRDADINGGDNRALQAAMDYIAGPGGGAVEIGEGEFLMSDSLHLRSSVGVRRTKGKTILRKANAASSPLAPDGHQAQEQSNDVLVQHCVSEDNAGLGLHPGSGSQRPVVRECVARRNGEDGLYLCWRVRHGLFEKNILENNGRFGISIGHKDSDNLLENNQVRFNHADGIYFRNETEGMAGHRNRLENNLIENNGDKGDAAGIRVRGQTRGLVFKNNIIRDTRPLESRKQAVGIRIEEAAGEVVLEDNKIEARTNVEDQRKSRP